MLLVFLVAAFLCWGSFLNVVAYRVIRNQGLLGRSRCPFCNKNIAWYDLIPIISWIILRGKCRSCKASISWLYPCIEAITTLALTLLYVSTPTHYFLAYFVFFSALIVTIRSDLETMLISRFFTLALIPVGFVASYLGLLPIPALTSILGCCVGYGMLWIPSRLFRAISGKDGIGQGDLDLMAMIGSFLGPFGCWTTVLIGSTTGALISIMYITITKKDRSARIPFGPFLAMGAIMTVFFSSYLHALLFGIS